MGSAASSSSPRSQGRSGDHSFGGFARRPRPFSCSHPPRSLRCRKWLVARQPCEHDVEEARDRHRPLRGRFRRWHAAGRRPLHRRHRARRQRPLDPAGLPGRDPRPGRHPRRRVGLPDPVRLARHPHPRRPPEHAGGDEPGGAESAPGGAGGRRHADRQRGRLHRRQPAQGRVREQPARGRHGRGLPDLQGADDDAHHARHRGHRGAQTGRGAADQEPLRPGPDLVDVRAARARRRSPGWKPNSPSARRSSPATSPPSRPGTTSATRPRSPRPRSRSPPPRWSRASTATSTAPTRWRWG